jgi:hypothetical protein
MQPLDLASRVAAVPAVVAARTAGGVRARSRTSIAVGIVLATVIAGCVPPGGWMGSGAWGWRGFAPIPQTQGPAPQDPYPQPPSAPTFTAPLQVYVTGAGGRVTAGEADNGPQWISRSLYNAGYSYADIPAYEGTAEEWRAMMTCAQNHFAGFPVQLVESVPSGDYLTVVVGGQAAHLGHAAIWGIASMGDHAVVRHGMGFVFSQDHGVQRGELCATLAHEIGHLVGLDHTSDCGDLMEVPRNCTRTGFLERSRAALAVSLAPYMIEPTGPTPTSYPIQRESDRFGYWPVSLVTDRPLARGLLHIKTPAYTSEYHCLPDGPECRVEGLELRGRYPLMEVGAYSMRIELFHLDGTTTMTPWITTAGL